MSRPKLVDLLLMLAVLEGNAQELVWSEPIVVHRTDQDPRRPRIVLNDDDRPVILWGETSPGANYVAIGEGNAFSIPQLIHPPEMHPAAADWQGSDVSAAGDHIHALMKMTPEISGGTYLVSSIDGGYTWGDTIRVDQVPGFKTRFSSIAVNGNGDPVVQYMRIDLDEIVHRTMVSRIANGVVQPPVDVSTPLTSGEDCDCCPGQIIAEDDRVIALFRDATENLRVIWAASSTDGGSTFEQGAQIDPTDWVLNACPSSGPAGILDGDSIHYVFMSGASDGSKVYLGSADFTSLNDPLVAQVHPGQQNVAQDHPRIAGSGDTLGVVWQQMVAGQTEILFSWKINSNLMSIPDTVNIELAGPQRTPDVAFHNGTFHFVWADHQQNSIMYRTASLMPLIGMDEERLPSFTLWPVPANDQLHVLLNDEFVGGSVRIHNAIYDLVLNIPMTPSIDVSSLADGVYSITISDRSGIPLARSRVVVAR